VELLSSAGIEFEVIPGDVSEEILTGETPEDYVERLARANRRILLMRSGC
jgi:septum formation protein